jgi:hypothetical protein
MLGNVTALWYDVVGPEIVEMRVPRNLNPIVVRRENVKIVDIKHQ